MADVKMNPIFEGLSRKVGDLVFFQKNGKTFLKPKGSRRDKNTEAQQEVRNAFSQLVGAWKDLNGIVNQSWLNYAKDKDGTGYNEFIGANHNAQRKGELITLSKDMGLPTPDSVIAASGAAGEISCAFTPLSEPENHITFFVQKLDETIATGDMHRYDAGANPTSPFVIAGLETGSDYHVYAVTTDAEYLSATKCSASASTTGTAG